MTTYGRTRAVTVSAVVVLVPAGGATTAAWQATSLATSGAAATHWAEALLLLACLACAGTLLWATAAAAAGVREGWSTGRRAAPDTGLLVVGGPRPRRVGPDRPGHVVAATVAAVVVAALTAGPATASARPTPLPAPVTAPAAPAWVSAAGTPAPAAAQEAVADDDDVPDGTWGALAHPPAPGPATAGQPVATVTVADEPFRAPRAVDPATTALITGTPSRSTSEREVVVRSGDSLWSLVQAHLGPGAGDDEVARTWPSWWQANRTTIGDDPDRLLPGQRLVVPVPVP